MAVIKAIVEGILQAAASLLPAPPDRIPVRARSRRPR